MQRWRVHLAGWLPIPWALDEDLAWVKRSLGDRCRWTSLPQAKIIHAAWPAAISAVRDSAVSGKTVVCQADNPPAFYLSLGGFDRIARRVDLWIARSIEAEEQFRLLGLPVARVPYSVDPEIFRPLGDREQIRKSLGIATDAFVIGNFHRDSEGSDLGKPKLQKGPDVFLEIVREVRKRVPSMQVLLAGPRRHWLLNALRSEGIPVVFSGEETGNSDDYPRNILSRTRLNELYQAIDVCLISSRWEGGPYSVLEALAAGCSVISTPVGTSRDVLPNECLFNTSERAAGLLASAATSGSLRKICSAAATKAASTHGPAAVARALHDVYAELPAGSPSAAHVMRSAGGWIAGRLFGAPKAPSGQSVPGSGSEELGLPCFDGRVCRTRKDLDVLAGRIRLLRADRQ